MITSGIVTRLVSTPGLLCIFALLALLLVLRLGMWHSNSVSEGYKQGYRTAQLEYEAAKGKKSVQAVQSARAERDTQEKHVRKVQEKANAVQKVQPSPGCTWTVDDLGLLNGTIETGNSWLRVHETSEVSRAREVQ